MQKIKNIVFITLFILLTSCGLSGCGADGTDSFSVEQSDFPDAVTEESLQGSEGDSTEQESMQDTQQDSGTTKTAPEVKPETKTSAASGEEINDLYDFGPVSYDLSALPAMENKLYAEWEGNVYFRKYSDEDLEEGALWANFGDISNTEKELMCLTPDGELTQMGTDYGCGAIYIVNGRLYSQKKVWEGDVNNIGQYVVYSCNLDGSDVREYDSDGILAVRGDKVICGEYRNKRWDTARPYSSLSYIDVQTGEEHVLVETKDSGVYAYYYLDATEEGIFYYGDYYNEDAHGWGLDCDGYDLRLYSVDYEGNTLRLTTVFATEFADDHDLNLKYFTPFLEIPYFRIMGDDLYFVVGWYDGSADVFQSGSIYSMKPDGRNRKMEAVTYNQYCYLYDDGVNRALYYRPSALVQPEGMKPIILMGEEPQNIELRKPYQSYDEFYVHSSTAYDPLDHSVYPDTSVLLYPDTSGICYVLLTEQDCEELSVDAYVDGSFNQDIKNVEYLDGKLFFTVTDLTYSFEESIGWRDGYLRGRTACYCKHIESGEIRLLYEY